MNRLTRRIVVGILALGLLFPGGCAAITSTLPKTEDVAKKRRELNARSTQEMQTRREFAEFQAAESKWNEGNLDECRRQLNALLEKDPEHLSARLLLADVLLTQNQPQEALKVLEPALQAHPADARVQYSMALVLDANGKRQEAQPHYAEAARLDPENEVYQVSYHQVRSSTAGQGGELVSYNEPADSAVPAAATTSSALVAQGGQALADGNLQAASACFQRAAADKPDDPQIPIAAAVAALRYNHPEIAVELLEPAVRRFPSSAALQRTLGMAYYRRGDYASSQVALQQALSLDKSNALSYFLMGCTLAKLGQPEGAERCFREARLLDPKYSVWR